MAKTNYGFNQITRMLGQNQLGAGYTTGTPTTAPTATTYTFDGATGISASSGSMTTGGIIGGLAGLLLIAVGTTSANTRMAVILSNTTSVATVGGWFTALAPGAATAASTPTVALNPTWIVTHNPYSATWMGLSVATRSPVTTDNFLTDDGSAISEVWASGGGLNRQLVTFAHTDVTAGGTTTTTYTLTGTFTANGSDSLPVTVAKIGVFSTGMYASPTTANSGVCLFNTNLSSTATLTASGDALTVTETVTET